MTKPSKKIQNENINESNISPIVIGSLRNLKLIYIKKADIETKRDDISNTFIISNSLKVCLF